MAAALPFPSNDALAERDRVIRDIETDLAAVEEALAVLEGALRKPPRGATEVEMQRVRELVVDLSIARERALRVLEDLRQLPLSRGNV